MYVRMERVYVLLVVHGVLCVCTILYTTILIAHKASPNATHWVLYYPTVVDMAELCCPSLVSSLVRTFELPD